MGLSSQQVSGSELDWSHNLLSNVSMEITQQPSGQPRNQQQPQQRQHMPPLKCPRCDSTNTKFCYYNNYSRTQPRHFCKACRRHWTQGGTLRNVPVGGGRKNKRTKTIPTNRNNNSTNSGNNPIITQQQQQQQQQQVVVPFGGDHKSEIFPDILRQMLLHSPPPPAVLPSQLPPSDYSFMGSLPFHSPFFPPQLGSTTPTAVSSYNNIVTPPFSISSSSTSPYIYKGQSSLATEEALNTINASTGSAWPGSTSGTGILDSSSGYWSGWDDDVNDLVTPEIKTSMADGSPRPRRRGADRFFL